MILIFQIVSLFVSCKMLELFEEYYEEAEKFLSKMTLEQKVGQMFFPKFTNDTKVKLSSCIIADAIKWSKKSRCCKCRTKCSSKRISRTCHYKC